MKISYSRLIAEHDQIEASALTLLTDLEDPGLSAVDLAGQLSELAAVVNRHVDVEDAILHRVESIDLPGPWNDAWREGLETFRRLRSDWTSFLDKWSSPTIAADRPGFEAEAQLILGRLRDRLAVETRAFYATALQTGDVALR